MTKKLIFKKYNKRNTVIYESTKQRQLSKLSDEAIGNTAGWSADGSEEVKKSNDNLQKPKEKRAYSAHWASQKGTSHERARKLQ